MWAEYLDLSHSANVRLSPMCVNCGLLFLLLKLLHCCIANEYHTMRLGAQHWMLRVVIFRVAGSKSIYSICTQKLMHEKFDLNWLHRHCVLSCFLASYQIGILPTWDWFCRFCHAYFQINAILMSPTRHMVFEYICKHAHSRYV